MNRPSRTSEAGNDGGDDEKPLTSCTALRGRVVWPQPLPLPHVECICRATVNSRAPHAPAGKHTAWAYCHVPHGSTFDMSERIEAQIERFAPGFGDLVLKRHTLNAAQLEQYNPNLVGGDLTGGVVNFSQLFARPARPLRPYTTPNKRIYLCSASTPPGGGVHGMSGHHAARAALRRALR